MSRQTTAIYGRGGVATYTAEDRWTRSSTAAGQIKRLALNGLAVPVAGARLLLCYGMGGGPVQVLEQVAAVVSGVAVGVASGRLVLEGILAVMFGRRS